MLPKHLIQTETIIKTVEVILQSRVNVKRAQQQQWNSVLQQIHKNRDNAYEANIYTFFNQLLMKQHFSTRQQLAHSEFQNPIHYVSIVFKLIQNLTKETIQTQSWVISFKRQGEQVKEQSKNMLMRFFQQLIIFLNHQPLLKEYHKKKYLKNNYTIDYQLKISQSKLRPDLSLIGLPTSCQKIRCSETFNICLSCYFVPSLVMVCGKQPLFDQKKKQTTTQKQRKSSDLIQDSQNMTTSQTKIFYDSEQELFLLSTDEKKFVTENQQKGIEQLIQRKDDDSDSDWQCEMLILSPDQNFLDENKSVFEKLKNMEIHYL